MSREHIFLDPLLPGLVKLRDWPTRACLVTPSHVNDCKRHLVSLNLEEDIVLVNPKSDCSHLQPLQDMLWRKVFHQPGREMLGLVLDFGRILNPLPRTHNLDVAWDRHSAD